MSNLAELSRTTPLTTIPEAYQPDRPEVINLAKTAKTFELSPGVTFECFVGSHNQARNLTTGFVTFAPGAELPYHTHLVGESVTLVEGELDIYVEGRVYSLSVLDNITLPRGVAHRVINVSGKPTIVHVALATTTLERTLVEDTFGLQRVEESSMGVPGREHVVRFSRARRYAAGPGTEFIDHLNGDLIPGIEMSGGYGLFHQGGRLPAHLHDFDESICIVQGEALCNVEDRLYDMSSGQIALQPRGRVHYFRNDHAAPMAMLWVYAGPYPERILVDQSILA